MKEWAEVFQFCGRMCFGLTLLILLLLHHQQKKQIEEISERPFCYKTQCKCSLKQP